MIRVLKISILLAFIAFSVQVSSQTFEVNSKIIGVSFGPAQKFEQKIAAGPSFCKTIFFDVGAVDLYPGIMTIGLDFSHYLFRYENSEVVTIYNHPAYVATWANFIIDGRVSYYYPGDKLNIPNLHLFASLNAGFRIIDFYEKYYGFPDTSLSVAPEKNYHFHYSLMIGSSYHFTNKFAVFAEVGYSESWAKAGLIYTLEFGNRLPKGLD